MTAGLRHRDDRIGDGYVPGTCNIGPAEIGRRRRVGHVGLAATLVGLALLLAVPISPLWRLLLFFPASFSASGYLQAILHFCAGFGSRGVYNFGPLGKMEAVVDPDALARDRARSNRIGLASGLIGLVVALAAMLLPI